MSVDAGWERIKSAACQVKQIFRGNPDCDHPLCSEIATFTFRLPCPDGELFPNRYYACTAHKPPGSG